VNSTKITKQTKVCFQKEDSIRDWSVNGVLPSRRRHTNLVSDWSSDVCPSDLPIGWDDNGLPTERRVQNVYGVRCDPTVPYDQDFTPPEKPGKSEVPISRRNFIELCELLTAVDE